MAKETLFDAISAAIAPPADDTNTATDTPAGDEPAGDAAADDVVVADAPASDAAAADDAAAAGDADKPEGEDADDADKKPDGEDEGDGKKKEGEEDPDAAAAAAGKPAAKKPDHVNDPIPQDLNERTRERMISLVKIAKDLTAQVATGRELYQHIAETGVTAENFQQTLTFLRLFNSSDVEDRRQAYNFLVKELHALAPLVGEVAPGSDPLDGHQDLKDAVAANEISAKHAGELAVNRNRVKAVQTATTNASSADKAWNDARTAAIADLNELELTLKAADAQYDKKRAQIITAMKPELARLHPAQWVKRFQAIYKGLKVAAPVVTPKPQNQPLRANKQPSGGGKAQPKTLQEAIDAGIASA